MRVARQYPSPQWTGFLGEVFQSATKIATHPISECAEELVDKVDQDLMLDIQRRQDGLNELLDLAARKNLRVEVTVEDYRTLPMKFARKEILIAVFKPLENAVGA